MWETETTNEDGSHSYDQGPTIRSFVNDFVKTNLDNYLHIHKEIIPIIQQKITESEQERKEISSIMTELLDKYSI
jgi:topoisomerase-4 subunit B